MWKIALCDGSFRGCSLHVKNNKWQRNWYVFITREQEWTEKQLNLICCLQYLQPPPTTLSIDAFTSRVILRDLEQNVYTEAL